MPDFTLIELKQAIREVVREELAAAGVGGAGNDPYAIIRKPGDPRFMQYAATAAILPDCWYANSLDYNHIRDLYPATPEGHELVAAHIAFLELNVGVYPDGTLSPIFGQLFAQADRWNDDGIACAVGPNVKEVVYNGTNFLRTDKGWPAPEGVNHPTHFAARITKPSQLVEWAIRSAPEFNRKPGDGTGFRPR